MGSSSTPRHMSELIGVSSVKPQMRSATRVVVSAREVSLSATSMTGGRVAAFADLASWAALSSMGSLRLARLRQGPVFTLHAGQAIVVASGGPEVSSLPTTDAVTM